MNTALPKVHLVERAELPKVWLARPQAEAVFQALSLAGIVLSIGVLLVLLATLFIEGLPRLDIDFFVSFPSRFAHKAGICAALVGSCYLMFLVALFSIPLGVGAAVYLEEYAPKNWVTRIIELNITNLAGVPSIIYGLLGLQLFVRYCNFGRSILAGALTLTLLILPIIIMAAREALRMVPPSIREGSYALGATKWQTVRHQVLPMAMPNIMTGCILAFSRAIGETAPLITLGALTYVAFVPDSIFSAFTALPIQAFNWLSRPQAAFHTNAAAAIIVLLAILLFFNALAIWFRYRFQKRT